MQGAALLAKLLPIESGVGFLLWVGLQITASGFEGDQTPEGWKHGPAVALGLIPSIAAWCWQSVQTTFTAARDLMCDSVAAGSSGALHASYHYCGSELHDLIQPASTPIAAMSRIDWGFRCSERKLRSSSEFLSSRGSFWTRIEEVLSLFSSLLLRNSAMSSPR